jgi:hypothetical protein
MAYGLIPEALSGGQFRCAFRTMRQDALRLERKERSVCFPQRN